MAAQNFLLHVHTSTDIVRKMTLSSQPASVDELKTMIKERFKLDFDFSLSYQDPDFDGQLCSLVDIEELPQKAVLKVIRSESDASSIAPDDTIILPHAMTPDRTERWPDVFPVPTFSYERLGKTLKLSRGQKHDILETLAAKMHCFKAYPNDREVSKVAEALVTQHPCLTEPGSQTGWYGWKNSLKFKMGNYRAKLSRAGFHEVAVNSGKRSRNNPDEQAPHTNIKRPKKAEVNFLPNFPRGQDAASLEQFRVQIADEVKMSEKNLPWITKLMQMTFSQVKIFFLVHVATLTYTLFVQICAEFHRITNMNLKNHFYAVLDQHSPRLQSLFRKKAARSGKVAEVTLLCYCVQMVETDEPNTDDIPVGLLSISTTTSATDVAFFVPERTAVVLEGNTVIECTTLSDAFVTLFALIYALHLSYPKDLANTLNFIQKVVMGLDDGKLRPRVLSLKNELLAVE
uniref:PB1 domain-containing protein n=1 Tax=Mastacembelus armatus TaxID=205130 RepID=A0A3Q3NBK1_9TELE